MDNSSFIEGVSIIGKYMPKDKKNSYDLHAEHDQIWFCSYDIVTDKKDIERLEELGWFEDEDSWSCFP